MIVDKSFTKEWIQAQRAANKGADPGLIEKQIYTFALLHYLVKGGKEFVFKGGTSLHLILHDHKRLSTDLDVVGRFTYEELQTLIANSRFARVEENIRKKKNIPKRHFKFFYTSAIDGRESYVLLDTLEEQHTYPKIEEQLIAHRLFETDEKVKVSTPTLEGILGDKLTVFAPHTVGIPFETGKSMEIVKQLFDIGELFDHCRDVKSMIERTTDASPKSRRRLSGAFFCSGGRIPLHCVSRDFTHHALGGSVQLDLKPSPVSHKSENAPNRPERFLSCSGGSTFSLCETLQVVLGRSLEALIGEPDLFQGRNCLT